MTKSDIFFISSRTTFKEFLKKPDREKGAATTFVEVRRSSVFSDRISLNGEAIRLPMTVKEKKTKTAMNRRLKNQKIP